MPNADGYPHIAYFSPPESSTPVFLTSGDWEVDGAIEAVDVARGLVCVLLQLVRIAFPGS